MVARCKIGLESTIIDLTNKPTILRLGGLDVKKYKIHLNKKFTPQLNLKKKYAWSIFIPLLSWNSFEN